MAVALLLWLALLTIAGGVDEPVPEGALDKVKNIIKRQIVVQKLKLTKDTKENDFCKRERAEIKDKLNRQGKVVKAKMDELAKAKAADKKFLEDELAAAKKQQAESAHDLAMAKAESGAVLMHLRSGRAASEPKERKTLEEVKFVKYELKKQVEALENLQEQKEILHDRCVAKVGAGMTAKERRAAREEEIQNLNKAYGILEDPY